MTDIHPNAPIVTIYFKPKGCVKCDATKRKFTKLGIPFVGRDVTADPNAAQRVRDLGYKMVPVVEVGDIHWNDHRDERINEAAAAIRAWTPSEPIPADTPANYQPGDDQ